MAQTLISKLLIKWFETQLNWTDCFKNTYSWVRHHSGNSDHEHEPSLKGSDRRWETIEGRVILEVCDKIVF